MTDTSLYKTCIPIRMDSWTQLLGEGAVAVPWCGLMVLKKLGAEDKPDVIQRPGFLGLNKGVAHTAEMTTKLTSFRATESNTVQPSRQPCCYYC